MSPDGALVQAGIPALGAALAAACLALGLRAERRRRLLEALPVSRTAGAFVGLVELRGTAESEAPLVSFLTGARCVWHRWRVEESWSREVEEGGGEDGSRTHAETGWTTVAEGGNEAPFYLRDDAGAVLVRPGGAKVEPRTLLSETCGPSDALYFAKGPPGEVAGSDHRRRFVERAIPLHAGVFVAGQARERSDAVAAEIAASGDAPLFLISTRPPERVSRGLRISSALLGLAAPVLAAGGFAARDLAARHPVASDARGLALAAAAALSLWLLGWAWTTYNALVDLRQRVLQGVANVDVQLQRRRDLLPGLVAAVAGLRDHERAVQAELAALRGQLAAGAPGGPAQAGCLPALRAVAEKVPALKADGSFLSLQRRLAECEERIALARSYSNGIAAHYNTRLEAVPDRLVALLAGLKPQPLTAAAGFERAALDVRLAS